MNPAQHHKSNVTWNRDAFGASAGNRRGSGRDDSARSAATSAGPGALGIHSPLPTGRGESRRILFRKFTSILKRREC